MRKRIFRVLLSLGMTISLLAGCGMQNGQGNENTGTTKAEGEEITLMIPDWGVPNETLLEEFTKETGIHVTVNEVSWDDIRDKIAIASSGGATAADVVEVDWSWVGEFYAADWLEPLEVTEQDKEDMPTLSTFTVDGKVLAMPYANDYRLSYYNTKQYEQAGITKEPETWNEVYEQMKQIKEAGVVEYPFAIPLNAEEGATTSLMWLAYTMNGIVFNEDGTLNRDSILSALEFEKKMIEEELVDPSDKTTSGLDAYRRITSGNASFMTGPTSFVTRSMNEEECQVVGQIQPILVPGKDGKSEKTMALPEAIGVTKFSKHKEAAKKFVKWYTSADIQKKLNETNSTIPTRNSVLEQLVNDRVMQNADAMIEEAKRIESPFPNGVPAYYAEMSNTIYNAVNQMARGELTPEKAFDVMDAKVKELVEQ